MLFRVSCFFQPLSRIGKHSFFIKESRIGLVLWQLWFLVRKKMRGNDSKAF